MEHINAEHHWHREQRSHVTCRSMRRLYSILRSVAVAAILLSNACVCTSSAIAATASNDAKGATSFHWNPVWDKWIQTMRAAGLSVLPGNAYPLTDCTALISVFGECFGTNPSSFYTIIQLPSADGFVDPYYAEPFEQQIPLPDNPASNCKRPGECIKETLNKGCCFSS